MWSGSGCVGRRVVGDEERGVEGLPRAGHGATGWIAVAFLEMVKTGRFELNSL